MNTLRPYAESRLLPSKSSGGAYVYVVDYTTDLVKVGWTFDPRRRIPQHHGAAQAHGSAVKRYWISEPHKRYLDSEAKLIGIARAGAREVRKSEYFVGANAAAIVREFVSWDGSVPPPVRPLGVTDPDDPFMADLAELNERTPEIPLTREEAAIWMRFRRRRLRGVA